MVGKWLAVWKYFKRAAEVKNSTIAYTDSSVISSNISCRAAHNKEVQRVIGTINDGPLYLLGAFTSIATMRGKGAN